MKAFIILAAVITALFFWQHEQTASAPPAAVEARIQVAVTPRPVSEHDWAKHSIDRANDVANQVRKTRAENQP